jgi:hypothetical protein
MRSIFRLDGEADFKDAAGALADWLWWWSDYSEGVEYEDLKTTAEEFLRQENPHLEINRD